MPYTSPGTKSKEVEMKFQIDGYTNPTVTLSLSPAGDGDVVLKANGVIVLFMMSSGRIMMSGDNNGELKAMGFSLEGRLGRHPTVEVY
jgi:hypothetical protein